jgi:hypothetical protein
VREEISADNLHERTQNIYIFLYELLQRCHGGVPRARDISIGPVLFADWPEAPQRDEKPKGRNEYRSVTIDIQMRHKRKKKYMK